MSEVIIIDPAKVVELQGPILAQLGKLVNACMKGWGDAPAAVKIELGNACTLMNQLVKADEQHKTEPGDTKGGVDGGAPAGTSGGGGDGAPAVVKANPPGVAAQRSPRVRKSRRLTS